MDPITNLKDLEQLSLGDFMNFTELAQLLSIRELARRKNQNPSTISRSLQNLEEALGKKLMARTPSGMTLTEEGQKLFEVLQQIFDVSQAALSRVADAAGQLHIGSSSFLSNRVIARIVAKLHDRFADIRVIDFPPDELVSSGIRGAFNVALHIGASDWPQSWSSRKIGDVSWKLCSRVGHPLARKRRLTIDEIITYPFVYPIYWAKNGLVIGNDQFPVSIFKRKRGFATSTAEAAALMLRHSDQLAFLPDVLVHSEMESGTLVSLGGDQFAATKPLYLSVRADVVTRQNFDFLAAEFSAFIDTIQT